jgi:uncharacterized integral membrane protein (TIGR00698 family)
VTAHQPMSASSAVQTASPIFSIGPGLLLSSVVALGAATAAPLTAEIFPVPAMVLALLIGIALNPVARRPLFQPGIGFCLKTILPIAVALLGLRIALADIAALGMSTAVLVVVAMAVTLASGLLFAQLFSQTAAYGALAGAGTAVCGASATLATSLVLPDYKGKQADVAFVAIAVNALSTAAMVLYPIAGAWLGFDQQWTGVMLGATIHDVAQVVGAGYAVSEPAGNTAVIVKLFRVFLLLPVVLVIGTWFARATVANVVGKVPVPSFAVAFIILCAVNSFAPSFPAIAPIFAQARAPLIEASTWGLLIAISALGLSTSLTAITALGWRHVATVTATTAVILVTVTAGLMLLR